jgi:lipopolysaccharide transport system permease protein
VLSVPAARLSEKGEFLRPVDRRPSIWPTFFYFAAFRNSWDMTVTESSLETAGPPSEYGAVARGESGCETREPGASEARPVTVIEPAKGWQLINFRELWQFRELLAFLVWRDVKVRYKQTLLGAAWAVLQPAMMMVVFTIFFGRMANVPSGDLPYPIFVYAGLLPWTFFSTGISNAANSVVGSERLITKIYFPRLAIPFASVGAAVVDFAIAFALLLAMMVWYGVMPGTAIFLVPVLCAMLAMAAIGVGTLLAALNVTYRDFRYVVPFLVQMWMFATPSVYMKPEGDSAGRLEYILAINPLVPIIGSFRSAVLGGAMEWGPLVLAGLATAVIFLAGCLYFRRVEGGFSDVI